MGVFLVVAILVGLSDRPKADEESRPPPNVEIQLVRVGQGRSEARISNHNDFAIYHLVASCAFRDRHGNVLASSPLTITDAVRGNASRVVRNLEFGAWPRQARTATCQPLEAKRMPE